MIKDEETYQVAISRYEELNHALPNTEEHKEKMHLVLAIEKYESGLWDLQEISQEEMARIRRLDFGFVGN